jgi:hypothetical protein
MVSDVDIAQKLLAIKSSADSRGIEFNLSLSKVKKLLSTKKCYISGVELNKVQKDDNQLTFDRLDNSKGYIDDNVVACSLRMNRLKGELTIEDITMLYKSIIYIFVLSNK